MKMILVLSVLVAVAVAAPPQAGGPDRDAVVVKSESDNIGLGDYRYVYETSNGISQQEAGQLQNAGSENEIMVVRGHYSYFGPDGVRYSVAYTADENGFHPEGEHIPH